MNFPIQTSNIRQYSPGIHDFRIDSYFIHYISIRTREKKNFFCKLNGQGLTEKTEGKILQKAWKEIPSKFPICVLGDHRIMPNEFHGILIFEKNDLISSSEKYIPLIIGAFKSRAARLINLMHGKHNRIIWHNTYIDKQIAYFSELQDHLIFLSSEKKIFSDTK